MKKMLMVLSCLLLIGLTSFAQEVGTDFMLNSNIRNFKTFSWSNQIDRIPTDGVYVGANGVVVFNNESTRSKIKDAISYELTARGYKMTENNADFLVHFIILEQPAEINTYNGYTLIQNGMDTVRTEENLDKTQVKAGTVLISFIDAKTSKLAWQGFVSGALQPNMINDQDKVRSAISSIFQQYRFKADGTE